MDLYSYCCLGVAAEIAGCKIVQSKMPSYIIHHSEVKGISKFPDILKGNTVGSIPEVLATINDRGENFRAIADYINENL